MHTRQIKNGLKPHIDYLKRVKKHYEDNRIILDYKPRGLQPSSGYLIDLGELGDDELHQDATDVKYAIIIIIIIPRFLSPHICPHTHSFCILDSQELHQTLHQG